MKLLILLLISGTLSAQSPWKPTGNTRWDTVIVHLDTLDNQGQEHRHPYVLGKVLMVEKRYDQSVNGLPGSSEAIWDRTDSIVNMKGKRFSRRVWEIDPNGKKPKNAHY